LLAALLCWLDARSRGARLLLRLEDLDPERCRPEWSRRMVEDVAWLGLDWDEVTEQHAFAVRHAAALDRLADAGRLYPCACSRKAVRALGLHAPDGSFRYPNTCRGRPLGPGGWRSAGEPLRVRLPEGRIAPEDEGGEDLAQDPAAELGDPVVVRRDGAVAYLLATVVDDAASRVDRIVRGRDLAPLTATQVALQRLLDLSEPVYRHHLLLLEEREETAAGPSPRKLAKLHGAVGAGALRARYEAPELCGLLACAAGLLPEPAAATPRSLLASFAWERVARRDRVLRWTGSELVLP
jgi:glutamyl-tRNA synthetase/glutamyl-Q tRNA(Asp) synthetase